MTLFTNAAENGRRAVDRAHRDPVGTGVWRRRGATASCRRLIRFRPMIEPGTAAPDFTLDNQDGEATSLTDYHGHWVVLYFYPKAETW